MRQQMRPLLIVVSAPSGAGKTTLCDRLLADFPGIVYSVSCTTRPARGREVDGEDYFFLSEEEFDKRVAKNMFLEHAVVHGSRYGTLAETVTSAMGEHQSVLMDIDIQGAAQIRERVTSGAAGEDLRSAYVDIFIAPPSLEELRRRIEDRGEDGAEVIEVRLRNARVEMDGAGDYMYLVVNDDLDAAYERFKAIVLKEMMQA